MNRQHWVAWWWYITLWGPCYALSQVFFRYQFSGKGNVPTTGPVLIVSNHQSNLDPVLVGLACPRQLKYLARKGLFFFPFNLWIRALGAFPIDRDKGAIAGIRAALNLLKQNNALVIFPEGSRTVDGRLQEMLPGFCLLARKSHATIVPAAIDGAFAALPRGSAFVRPHRIKMAFDAALTPSQYEQLTDAELTQIVTNRIERTFQRLQRDGMERQIVADSAAKPANRLLASPAGAPGLSAEKSV